MTMVPATNDNRPLEWEDILHPTDGRLLGFSLPIGNGMSVEIGIHPHHGEWFGLINGQVVGTWPCEDAELAKVAVEKLAIRAATRSKP